MDIDSVLDQLTLEEKASLISGADFWHTVAVERLDVPAIMCSDGPHGLRAQVAGQDHGGLLGSVPATCFPTASAIASTWDPALIEEVGAAIGQEARKWNVSVVLGPGVNIKRSPLCGRNFEYISEDPLLAGELGAAIVRGLQSKGVGASMKHFAANNQEDDRLRVSAVVDERTLREIYLPAFERIAAEGPWTVMCAYNKLNDVYASEHRWLLTTVLRDEWGWDGVVVSDWGATHDRVAAVEAGLDWEMPPDLERSPAAVVAAVEHGTLDEKTLDRSVRRMLELVERARPIFDTDDEVDADAHHQLARRAAAESIVMLANDGLLPLDPATTGRLAVIGKFARKPRFQGTGSSQVNPTRVDTLLDSLEAAFTDVHFAAGYTLDDAEHRAADDLQLRDDAVALAAGSDVVVCMLGLPHSYESEGFDRTHIDLPGNQVELLESVLAVNQKVIVVLVNGSVVRVADWADDVPAILECWLGGQAAGAAIADVIVGAAEPGGRLAETIPVRLEDNTAFLNFPGDSGRVIYGERIFVGYRGYDRLGHEVSFPFGHGLSYTTFEMSELSIEVGGDVAADTLQAEVAVTVTNTGGRRGSHVVQVYVGDVESSVARPDRELKGFAKVRLDPGESQRVAIALPQRAFSFWSETAHTWVVEPGDFTICVGSSSRDLALRETVTIDAPSIVAPLTRMSTLHEWLADPDGRRLLLEMAKDDPLINNAEFVRIVGTMPLDTLAGFPNLAITHTQLDQLVASLQ